MTNQEPIQRYQPSHMAYEKANGDYVLASDYDALLATVAALQAQVDKHDGELRHSMEVGLKLVAQRDGARQHWRRLENELSTALATTAKAEKERDELLVDLKALVLIGVFCGKCGKKYTRCELCGGSTHQNHELSDLHEPDCILINQSK